METKLHHARQEMTRLLSNNLYAAYCLQKTMGNSFCTDFNVESMQNAEFLSSGRSLCTWPLHGAWTCTAGQTPLDTVYEMSHAYLRVYDSPLTAITHHVRELFKVRLHVANALQPKNTATCSFTANVTSDSCMFAMAFFSLMIFTGRTS